MAPEFVRDCSLGVKVKWKLVDRPDGDLKIWWFGYSWVFVTSCNKTNLPGTIVSLKPVFHKANFFARSEFFGLQKSRNSSNSLFRSKKSSQRKCGEKVVPIRIKLRMRELEKICFARRNSLGGKQETRQVSAIRCQTQRGWNGEKPDATVVLWKDSVIHWLQSFFGVWTDGSFEHGKIMVKSKVKRKGLWKHTKNWEKGESRLHDAIDVSRNSCLFNSRRTV